MFNDLQLGNIEEIRKFLNGSVQLVFQPLQYSERAQWIRKTLIRFKYATLRRTDKQAIRQYLMKISNLSRSQVARHIKAYKKGQSVCIRYERHAFRKKYTQSEGL